MLEVRRYEDTHVTKKSSRHVRSSHMIFIGFFVPDEDVSKGKYGARVFLPILPCLSRDIDNVLPYQRCTASYLVLQCTYEVCEQKSASILRRLVQIESYVFGIVDATK